MNSFISWVGGKRLLRNALCDRFPGGVKKYVEVFGGAGWVLFNKESHAAIEVYNDINSELVNLFRCVKYHPEAIIKEMEFLLNSREIFNCFKNQSLEGLTDIQRAARYLYLIKASYGSKLKDFGVKPRNRDRNKLCANTKSTRTKNKQNTRLLYPVKQKYTRKTASYISVLQGER